MSRQTSPHWAAAMRDSDCLSIRDGVLHIEGVSTLDLAERYGTPLFAFSESQLSENLRRFREAFAAGWPGPVDVLPAMKANTMLAIRRLLSRQGAGADIYSPEELAGVLRTGVDPERVSVNGGGKSRSHLRACVEAGVRITVEDVEEIEVIQQVAAELDTTARIRFRVKPAFPSLWRRTDFSQLTVPIDLGIQVYKSGIPPEYLPSMGRRALAMPNVDLVGIHFHAGRHHPSLWYWEGMMVQLARLVGELSSAWGGWQPSEIDIGGGFASPRDPLNKEFPRSEFVLTALGYPFLVGLRGLGERAYHTLLSRILALLTSHADPEAPPAIEEYGRAVTAVLTRELPRHGIDIDGVRLQVEPGRAMYGDAGIHLATVKTVKSQHHPIPYTWVLTDTTYFFLAGGVFEHNRHPFVFVGQPEAAAHRTADIVGHSCYADQIVLGARVPDVRAGEVIAFLETGAYQESSASNFNSLPRPASVLVHGETVELIKRAETIDDVYGRDIVPERLNEPASRS